MDTKPSRSRKQLNTNYNTIFTFARKKSLGVKSSVRLKAPAEVGSQKTSAISRRNWSRQRPRSPARFPYCHAKNQQAVLFSTCLSVNDCSGKELRFHALIRSLGGNLINPVRSVSLLSSLLSFFAKL